MPTYTKRTSHVPETYEINAPWQNNVNSMVRTGFTPAYGGNQLLNRGTACLATMRSDPFPRTDSLGSTDLLGNINSHESKGTRGCVGKNGYLGWCVLDTWGGNNVRFFKAGPANALTAKAVLAVYFSECQGGLMYDSVSDTYHFINARVNAGKDELQHWQSTDDMATWTGPTNTILYTPDNTYGLAKANGVSAIMDTSGNIHVAACSVVASGKTGVMYIKWTKSGATWGTPVTVYDTGQNENAGQTLNYKGVVPQITLTPDGIHIVSHHRTATNNQYKPHYFSNRAGAGWSAAQIIGGDVAYERVASLQPRADGTLTAIVAGKGNAPTTTNSYLSRYEISATDVIGAVEMVENSTAGWPSINNNIRTYYRYQDAPLAGVQFRHSGGSASSRDMHFTSSDCVWRTEDADQDLNAGVAINTTAVSHSNWGHNDTHQVSLVRTSGARVYFVYTIGATYDARYIKCRYSDDAGATWSAEEAVVDILGSETSTASTINCCLDASEDLMVMACKDAQASIRFFSRSSLGVWTEKTAITADHNLNQVGPRFSYNRTQGKFHVFVPKYIANASIWQHYESSDNCVTWSTVDTSAGSGGATWGYGLDQAYGCDCYMDTATGIHHMSWYGPAPGTNYFSIWYMTRDTSGVWSTAENIYNTGAIKAAQQELNIVVDGSSVPHIFVWADIGGATLMWYISRIGTDWQPFRLGANPMHAHACVMGDGSVRIYSKYNSSNDTYFYTIRSGFNGWDTRARVFVTNASGFYRQPVILDDQSMVTASRFRDGHFFVSGVANDSKTYLFKSPSISFGGLTSQYTKTCATTWSFSSTLAIQSYVVRSIDSGTTTEITGGGRQTILAGSTIWHVWHDGSGIKASYSTDGVIWTATTVASMSSVGGLAMNYDGASTQIVAFNNATGNFCIYEWSGSAWVAKTTSLYGSTTYCESFQLINSGSTYYLIWAADTGSVYYRTSYPADLTSWNATATLAAGDAFPAAPASRYRRLAACLDSSAIPHVVFSVPVTPYGHWTLWYKYSGGSWVAGSAATLYIGGTGTNLSDFASGFSIAIDSSGKLHMAYRRQDVTYTGRVRVQYMRVSSTAIEVDEIVHSVVDANQGAPSLSLNGSLPVICWDSAGLGLGVVDARRDGAGTWTYGSISTATRTNVHTIWGPGYGSNRGYGRGVAGTMHGTEDFFSSSDAMAGTGAQVENTLTFSGILSTQKRLLASTWAFISALIGANSRTMINTWQFTQQINTQRSATMENTWELQSVLGGSPAQGIINQTWVFVTGLLGTKEPGKTISQTLTFTSVLSQAKGKSMVNTWTFTHGLGSLIYKNKSIAQTWTLVSTLRKNFSLNKPFAQTWGFISACLGFKGDEGCEPTFTPDRPLPTSEDDVLQVYLIGPLPTPTLAVQLKRPNYGNSRRQSLQVRVNRTRAGGLKVHARTPTYEPQTMEFTDNSLLKLEQVRNFLRTCKGKKVYYIDENNRKWEGYILSSDVDLAVDGRDRGGLFQLDFEGRLV